MPCMRGIWVLIFFAFLALSCRPPVGDLKPPADGPETAGLRISFSSSSRAGGPSRTVVPASDLGITSITVTVRRGAAVLASAVVGSAGDTCLLEDLSPGLVTVEAGAYAEGTLVATGEADEPFTLAADEVKAVRIALLPAADAGTGTIRIALRWPLGAGAGYVECALDGGSAAGAAGTEIEPGTMGYTYEKEEAGSGAHELSITFYDNSTDRHVLGSFVEAVNVYANCVSDSWLDGEGGVLPERVFGAEEMKSSLSMLSKLVLTGEGLSIALTPAGTPALVADTSIGMGKVASGSVWFTAVLPGGDTGQTIGYSWNGVSIGTVGSGERSEELPLAGGGWGNTLEITVTSAAGSSSVYTVTMNRAFRLSFDGNGATGGDAPPDELRFFGESVIVPERGTLSMAGSILSGWNTAEDGSGSWYPSGAVFAMPASDFTLYAVWVPDLGREWTEREVPVTPVGMSWFAIASSDDGTHLAACVQGGCVYTSADGGMTWTERIGSGSRKWRSLASSADGMHLAACVDGGYIYTSPDGGNSWTERTGSGSRNWYCIASSADGARLAAGVLYGIIYTSSDGGETWTPTASGNGGWYSIASSRDGTRLAACVYGGNIYTSPDGGETWIQTASGTGQWVGIASSSDGIRLAACERGGYVYTSENGGETWTERTGSGNNQWQRIASSADGMRLSACKYEGNIYTTTDGGVSWSQHGVFGGYRRWRDVASSSDGTRLAACVYGGYLYTSADSGITWSERSSAGNRGWQYIASSADGMKLIASYTLLEGTGGLSPYLYTTSNGGVSWNQRTEAGQGSWGQVASSSDGTKVAVRKSNSLFTGFYNGTTWTWTEQTAAGSRNWNGIASSADGMRLAACVGNGSIWTGTWDGTIWTWSEQTGAGSRQWSGIAGSSDGTRLAACVGYGSIWTGTWDGTSWTWTERPSAGTRYWTRIWSSDNGSVLAACAGGNNGTDYIFVSSNGGADWIEQTAAGKRAWSSVTGSADGTKLAAAALNVMNLFTSP